MRDAFTSTRGGAPGPGPPHPPSTERASSPPAAPASPAVAPTSSPAAPASSPAALADTAPLARSTAAAPLSSTPPESSVYRDSDGGCRDDIFQSRGHADAGNSSNAHTGAPEARGRRHSNMKRNADEGKFVSRKRVRFSTESDSRGRNSSEAVGEAEVRAGQLGSGIYRSLLRGVEQAAVAVLPHVLSPGLSLSDGTAAVGAANGEKDDSALSVTAGETVRMATAADKDEPADAPPERMALTREYDVLDLLDDQAVDERTDAGHEMLDGSVPLMTAPDGALEDAAPFRASGADTLNNAEVEGRHMVLPKGNGTDGSDEDGSESSILSSCKLSELSDAASTASSSLEDDREAGGRPVTRRRRGMAPLARTWAQGVQYQNMSPSDLAAACRRYADEESAAGRPIVAPPPDWSRRVAIPIEGDYLRVASNRRRKRVFRMASRAESYGGSAAAAGGSTAPAPQHRSSGPSQGSPPADY